MKIDIQNAFYRFDGRSRDALLTVREDILDCAKQDADITKLEECLKWGQPSYVWKKGSTVRLGMQDGQAAVFFTCSTGLVDRFRDQFPEGAYHGNRVVFIDGTPRPALQMMIRAALRYHLDK